MIAREISYQTTNPNYLTTWETDFKHPPGPRDENIFGHQPFIQYSRTKLNIRKKCHRPRHKWRNIVKRVVFWYLENIQWFSYLRSDQILKEGRWIYRWRDRICRNCSLWIKSVWITYEGWILVWQHWLTPFILFQQQQQQDDSRPDPPRSGRGGVQRLLLPHHALPHHRPATGKTAL